MSTVTRTAASTAAPTCRTHRFRLASAAVLAAASAVLAGALPAAAAPDALDVSPEQELSDAITVVDTYWANNYQRDFGDAYIPPSVVTGAAGVTGMYTSGTDSLPCGTAEGLLPNNAIHCSAPIGQDWVGVSDDLLFSGEGTFGDAFTYLVVAHEWGHAIQQRHPEHTAPWPELQADCFAGATLAGAAAQGQITWDAGDDAEIAQGLQSLGDKTAWTDSRSHGSAQQRTAFFQHGVTYGVAGCLYTG